MSKYFIFISVFFSVGVFGQDAPIVVNDHGVGLTHTVAPVSSAAIVRDPALKLIPKLEEVKETIASLKRSGITLPNGAQIEGVLATWTAQLNQIAQGKRSALGPCLFNDWGDPNPSKDDNQQFIDLAEQVLTYLGSLADIREALAKGGPENEGVKKLYSMVQSGLPADKQMYDEVIQTMAAMLMIHAYRAHYRAPARELELSPFGAAQRSTNEITANITDEEAKHSPLKKLSIAEEIPTASMVPGFFAPVMLSVLGVDLTKKK